MWVSPAPGKRLTAAALTCLVAVAHGAPAARPRYGGTVRLGMPGAIATLDPSAVPADAEAAAARDAVLPLVFETLTRAGVGGLEPLLAQSWESDAQQRRWRFQLRPGVKLHDGTALTATAVAKALNAVHGEWTAMDDGSAVVVESDRAVPDLPWDLADARRAIVVPSTAGLPLGTGPFRLDRWEPGHRLVLAANDDYRDGRPFADAVQVDMSRAPRDALADLETSRVDLVPLSPQDARRVSQRALRVESSRPRELVALVFDTRRPAASQERLRGAAARAIDRSAICTTLLQRHAEPASALLPDWLSGYASIFASRYDPARAKAIVASLPAGRRALSLEYWATDDLAESVADRVAVDLREAGLAITLTPASRAAAVPPDGRVVRVLLEASTPDRSLAGLLAPLGLASSGAPAAGAPIGDVARFEQALLEPAVVVPLVHVPAIYGVADRVRNANGPLVTAFGRLNLADVWLREERP